LNAFKDVGEASLST